MRSFLRFERRFGMGLDGKKDVRLDVSTIGSVSRLEVLEGPSERRTRSEAEKARIVAESLMPGAQVSEVARQHGAMRWQVYDWRRRLRQRSELASREAPGSTFASLMVEEPLKERPARLARLGIAIGDIVVRTDVNWR
ncbi:transposase IS3/IS911 [Nitrobacter hamburgensis X14]|uniref:Transposase IS3/IS911 n=2 Tax=Nitrobacter hamburgensis TaxID=912 RepID=Q1QLY0_NITHX|nr:transposase IS3/IS911 [Nitrobacter hamburgensis X14]